MAQAGAPPGPAAAGAVMAVVGGAAAAGPAAKPDSLASLLCLLASVYGMHPGAPAVPPSVPFRGGSKTESAALCLLGCTPCTAWFLLASCTSTQQTAGLCSYTHAHCRRPVPG